MKLNILQVDKTARLLKSGLMATATGLFAFTLAGGAHAMITTSDSQIHYTAAESAAKKGDFEAAIIELKNAVRSDPTNSDARYELALLYLKDSAPAAALPELEAARSHGYDDKKLALPLAQCYLALGRYKDVLSKVDSGKLSGDTYAGVLAAQARASIALSDLSGAHRMLDEALKAAPSLPSALVASAILMNAEGKFAEAEVQLDKATDDNSQVEIPALKGELRQKQGDLEGAAKYFDIAVARFPNHVGIRIERAILNQARGRFADIEQDDNWVLAREPHHPLALYLQAYLLAHGKKYHDASQSLLALPQLLEHYPPAMYLLAATALEDGQVDLALDYAQRYLHSVPNDLAGGRLLALVQQRANVPERAVAILEPLAARYPTDNALKLQFAEALLAAGRSAEAITLFQQGLVADPNNSQARLALAAGQLQMGQTDLGVAQIEKILQAEPTSLQANTLMILTQLQLHRPDIAHQTAMALIKADSSDPEAYNLQGTVYLATGDFVNARVAFQTALAKNPKFVSAVLNLGKVEERSGNRAAAKRWYVEAITIAPTNMSGYEGLSNIALAEDNVDEATASLKQAIARNSDAAEPRLRLIDMLLEKKLNKQALIEARDFLNAAPQSPQALDALGRAQLINGETANGLASYQQLAVLNPDNAEVQRRLGQAFMRTEVSAAKGGNPKYSTDARDAFDQAVTLAPDDREYLADRLAFERGMNGPVAAVTLAQTYVTKRPESEARLDALGDTQEAAGQMSAATLTYQRAWEKSKSSFTTLRVYAGLKQEGKSDEGVKFLKTWVATHPNDLDVRFLIANDDLVAGKTEEALTETETLSAALPDNPILLNNLAWLNSKRNPAKAIEYAERAYAIAPGSPDVLDTLGWLRVTATDVARGEPLLAKAYETAPARGDIGFHYAYALERSNKGAAAKAVLEKTLAGDLKFAERADAQALFNKLSGSRAAD